MSLPFVGDCYDMFAEVWEFLKQLACDLTPIAKVDAWERAVILRFGRFQRERGPGWWWKIPICETCVTTPVVATTSCMAAQSLYTQDGKSVVVEAIVRYTIGDVRKFLLDVYDRADAINDMTMGIIAKAVSSNSWDQCRDPGFEREITTQVRKALKRWGVNVDEVTLITLTTMRSLRLVGGTSARLNDL